MSSKDPQAQWTGNWLQIQTIGGATSQLIFCQNMKKAGIFFPDFLVLPSKWHNGSNWNVIFWSLLIPECYYGLTIQTERVWCPLRIRVAGFTALFTFRRMNWKTNTFLHFLRSPMQFVNTKSWCNYDFWVTSVVVKHEIPAMKITQKTSIFPIFDPK